uniref:Uncharacterized protein n=1 Tax=Salmonella sp. TaxID=599 RepID=A0A482ETH0_SALSP|nr:hypothetical protein NNIBIDOC_00081 [Salmonella sp.]
MSAARSFLRRNITQLRFRPASLRDIASSGDVSNRSASYVEGFSRVIRVIQRYALCQLCGRWPSDFIHSPFEINVLINVRGGISGIFRDLGGEHHTDEAAVPVLYRFLPVFG